MNKIKYLTQAQRLIQKKACLNDLLTRASALSVHEEQDYEREESTFFFDDNSRLIVSPCFVEAK